MSQRPLLPPLSFTPPVSFNLSQLDAGNADKFLLTKSFDTVMSLPSVLLTILGLVPRLLGELDSINATIIRRSGIVANKKQI